MRRPSTPITERQLTVIVGISMLVTGTIAGVLFGTRLGLLAGIAAFVILAAAEGAGYWFMLRRRREMIERGEFQARR